MATLVAMHSAHVASHVECWDNCWSISSDTGAGAVCSPGTLQATCRRRHVAIHVAIHMATHVAIHYIPLFRLSTSEEYTHLIITP